MTSPAPSRLQEIVAQVRRWITDNRVATAAIAAGLVVVLVVVGIVTIGGGGGSPRASSTGSLPPPTPSSSSSTVSGKPAIPTSGAYLGAYAAAHVNTDIGGGAKSNGGATDTPGTAIAALEQQVGSGFAIDHRYYTWDQPFSVDAMRQTAAKGRIPFLAFHDTTFATVSYADIADGKQDASLDARADAVKAFGKPVFVSFQHEPADSIGPADSSHGGTPEQFKAAWRHIVQVFRDRGATNAAFTWVETAFSFRQATGDTDPDSLYPGDDVIDWIAADGYSFYGCALKPNASWMPFSKIFQAFYDWGTAHHKPLMVAELGVQEDPAQPDRKARWYAQAVQQLKSDFPQIKAVVYFNAAPQCPNWVDSSAQSLAAFQALAKDPYFITRTGG